MNSVDEWAHNPDSDTWHYGDDRFGAIVSRYGRAYWILVRVEKETPSRDPLNIPGIIEPFAFEQGPYSSAGVAKDEAKREIEKAIRR